MPKTCVKDACDALRSARTSGNARCSSQEGIGRSMALPPAPKNERLKSMHRVVTAILPPHFC
jgi:hypothetical protein